MRSRALRWRQAIDDAVRCPASTDSAIGGWADIPHAEQQLSTTRHTGDSMSRFQMQRRGFTPPFMSGFAREVDQLQDSINRMFETPFAVTPRFPRIESLAWVPPVEVSETDTAIVMTVELPGIDRNDVTIDVQDDILTLRGEKKSERVEKDEKKEFYLEERSYGAFERSFTLPPNVSFDEITARFDKGVLEITLPKSQVTKPRGREVAIEAT
jgi:HSP20 family protein